MPPLLGFYPAREFDGEHQPSNPPAPSSLPGAFIMSPTNIWANLALPMRPLAFATGACDIQRWWAGKDVFRWCPFWVGTKGNVRCHANIAESMDGTRNTNSYWIMRLMNLSEDWGWICCLHRFHILASYPPKKSGETKFIGIYYT